MPDFSINGSNSEIMVAVYDRINNVLKKPLHKGQIQLAKDYFVRGMRTIVSQWGRSGGKTESALFIATVASLLTPNHITYIITPERKQGKEIYWASKRLQNYPPPQYVHSHKESEIRTSFKNGSFIAIDGCENYNALRGLKPNLVIYDEFQAHSKEFHLEVMAPNLLAKGSALITFATPPKSRAAYYVEFWENLKKAIKNEDFTKSYYEFPTSINPSIDLKELEKVRKELIESGNEVIWYREYEGKMAFGGEDIVFPKWNPTQHVRSHRVVVSYLEHDRHKLKWYVVCDPGTSTCFAVLFLCYNPFTQQIFILDEIYEKDRKKTDSKNMWERIQKKVADLYPGAPERTFHYIYDEAAPWFANEVRANYHVALTPSDKYSAKEDEGISAIKMLMAHPGAVTVSDRCYWLRWEIESYVTDEDGTYPDRHNHLIDDFRYFLQRCGWKLLEKPDNSLIPSVNQIKGTPLDISPEDWSDNVVENSLWIDPNDIYSEYFN